MSCISWYASTASLCSLMIHSVADRSWKVAVNCCSMFPMVLFSQSLVSSMVGKTAWFRYASSCSNSSIMFSMSCSSVTSTQFLLYQFICSVKNFWRMVSGMMFGFTELKKSFRSVSVAVCISHSYTIVHSSVDPSVPAS